MRSIRISSQARGRERREGFDRRFGTDTDRRLSLKSLLARGDDVVPLWRYFGTLERPFRRALEALGVIEEDHVFVDLGCGKGRALLMASERPFRRIVGVELSPALLETARRNVDLYTSPTQRCTSFELVNIDAANWEPPLENLVLYMFQPFPRDVMQRMLDNVERSLHACPRRVTVAYYNPIFGDLFWRSPTFRLRASGEPEQQGEFRWEIYESAA